MPAMTASPARVAAATLLLVLPALAALAACQSSSSAGATSDPPTRPASPPSAPPSAARPPTIEDASGPSDAGVRSALGAVQILQSRAPSRSNLNAHFFDTTYADRTQADPCSDQTPRLGGCSVCVSHPHLDGGSATTRPPAGTIEGSVGTKHFQLEPDRLGTYIGAVDTPLLRGGETLHIEATGDPQGVPAFSGQVVAPVFVTLTPASKLHDGAQLALGSPVDVAWSPPSPDGRVHVELTAIRPGGLRPANESAFTYLVCDFDGTSGKGTIPASAIGLLSPGVVGLTLESVSTSRVTAGAFAIKLEVSDTVVSGTVQLN